MNIEYNKETKDTSEAILQLAMVQLWVVFVRTSHTIMILSPKYLEILVRPEENKWLA